jgi:uncharacterized protein (DUF1499 family)
MRASLIAVGVSGVALLLLGLAGPAYRLGVSLQTAFGVLRWGAYIGVLGVAAGVIALLWSRRRPTRWGPVLGGVAVLLGAIAVAIPYLWQRQARSVPPIHDISTDLENPPQFTAVVPLRAEAPNSLDRGPELPQLQREGYPDIAPVTLSQSPDDAFMRVLAAAQDSGWEIVSADQSSGHIEATDTTRWFGFKDDVVVRLTPWGTGTRVDVRSVSRVGRSDVGTNARRIEEFLDRLQDG